jgi:hypothetical protein
VVVDLGMKIKLYAVVATLVLLPAPAAAMASLIPPAAAVTTAPASRPSEWSRADLGPDDTEEPRLDEGEAGRI